MDTVFLDKALALNMNEKPTSGLKENPIHSVNEQKFIDANSDISDSDQSTPDLQVKTNSRSNSQTSSDRNSRYQTMQVQLQLQSQPQPSVQHPQQPPPPHSPPPQIPLSQEHLHVNFPTPPSFRQYHNLPFPNDQSTIPGTPPLSPPITNSAGYFTHPNSSRIKSSYDFGGGYLNGGGGGSVNGLGNTNTNTNYLNSSSTNLNESAQRSSDLANWAPSRATPAQQSSNIANLPDWRIIEGDRKAQTSLPTSLVQADLDYSMRHLLSENVFEELIRDPLGRHRFREYLEQSSSPSTYKLDYWTDVDVFERIVGQIRAGSQALHDLYIAPSSNTKVDMPPNHSEMVFHRLRYLNELDSGLLHSQTNLLHSLYEIDFQNFIRHKLIERSKVRLGKENLNDLERNGLGDSFVLTNPRLRDHPIVMSSLGFTKVSGFDRTTIIGRNCRFLQGPGTAPASVQRIRDALNNAEPITELLLNYRRDGTPFFCLVNIIPLRDTKGQVAYFIGGQVNVTGILSSKKNLSFLVGGSAPYISNEAVSNTAVAFSPTMQRYNNHERQPESMSRVGAGSIAAGSFEDQSTKEAFNGARAFDHFQPEPEKSGNILSRLFNSSQAKKDKRAQDKSAQRLPGAENMLGKEAQPIEKQMEFFNHTYNKLMIVKREKREIVFVTKELLGYLGLPTETIKQCTDSQLNHQDLIQLLTCGSEHRLESKRIKTALKQAFKEGIPLSVTCGIKCRSKFSLRGNSSNTDIRFGVLHATPLEDRDGGVYVRNFIHRVLFLSRKLLLMREDGYEGSVSEMSIYTLAYLHFHSVYKNTHRMLHLPDRIQSAESSKTVAMDTSGSSTTPNPKPTAFPPLQHRMTFHRTKGSLLRPPPSQKVDIDRCSDIGQLQEIIHRFDRLSTRKLLPVETLAAKREHAQRRISELEKRDEEKVHEGISNMSLKSATEKPVDSSVFMSTHDSLALQKEEVTRQESARMMSEVVNSSRKAQDEAYAQFVSDSDDSEDSQDDDNWLLPSFSRRRGDAHSAHDEQDEQLEQINNLDINEDELTNAHVDAAGSLLERGDT
ncbi:hypothetical protein E3P92_02886 [Wallemia ichthyophaga]|nr:hypothetical protein E3P92_02886 [Wallemia ichthyophaga]